MSTSTHETYFVVNWENALYIFYILLSIIKCNFYAILLQIRCKSVLLYIGEDRQRS